MASVEILNTKLDALTEQVALLVSAERRRSELYEDFVPILRQVLGVATNELATLEQRGYRAFGKGLLDVLDRIVSGHTPEDLEELGQNVVSILDTLRALTRPEVMDLARDISGAVDTADQMDPVGVMGMAKAARDADAQQGMAVLVEALRRLGKGVKRAGRRESLQRQLGSRRRVSAVRSSGASERRGGIAPQRSVSGAPTGSTGVAQKAAAPAAPVARAEAPRVAAVSAAGVEFTPDGFLVDYERWSPELAQTIAGSIGVRLTEQHWRVVNFARQEYQTTRMSPNIRRLTTGSGLSTKEIYGLFPKAPGKCTAMIAGLPKPVGCI